MRRTVNSIARSDARIAAPCSVFYIHPCQQLFRVAYLHIIIARISIVKKCVNVLKPVLIIKYDSYELHSVFLCRRNETPSGSLCIANFYPRRAFILKYRLIFIVEIVIIICAVSRRVPHLCASDLPE